jgi:hypothetical protein
MLPRAHLSKERLGDSAHSITILLDLEDPQQAEYFRDLACGKSWPRGYVEIEILDPPRYRAAHLKPAAAQELPDQPRPTHNESGVQR